MALMRMMLRTVFVSVCFLQAHGVYCPGTHSDLYCPQYGDDRDECCQANTPNNYCCSWNSDFDYSYQLGEGAIVGIVIGSLILIGTIIAIIVGVCCCFCCAAKSGAGRRRAGPATVTHIQGGTPMTAQSYPQGPPAAFPGGPQAIATAQPPYPGQQAYIPSQAQAYAPTSFGQPPTGQYPVAQAAGQYYPPISAPASQYPQPSAPCVMAGTVPSDPPPQYENPKVN